MWKAQIVGKAREQDQIKVNVRFFDDVNEAGTAFVLSYTATAGSLEWIRKQVYRKIQQLVALDQAVAAIPEGDVTGLEDPAPTAAELAKSNYASELSTFKRMYNAVQLGIFTGNEAAYTTKKQWLIDNFQNGYTDLF